MEEIVPTELRDQIVQAILQSALVNIQASIATGVEQAYAAGVSSVTAGGFSQADIDAAKEQGKSEGKAETKAAAKAVAVAAVDTHDANTQVDADLKAALEVAIDAL